MKMFSNPRDKRPWSELMLDDHEGAPPLSRATLNRLFICLACERGWSPGKAVPVAVNHDDFQGEFDRRKPDAERFGLCSDCVEHGAEIAETLGVGACP